MTSQRLRQFVAHLISVSLISMGFMQAAAAGTIGTSFLADAEVRDSRAARIHALLAADAVSAQLESLGVDPAAIAERVDGLSDAELMELEARLGEHVAAGDVVGIVGVVFVVLIILELVGVTDIFKAF